jgi:hypothetical protein
MRGFIMGFGIYPPIATNYQKNFAKTLDKTTASVYNVY